MKAYTDFLKDKGLSVNYIEATSETSDIRALIPELIDKGLETLHIIDPSDNWLEKHIKSVSEFVHVSLFFYFDEKSKFKLLASAFGFHSVIIRKV